MAATKGVIVMKNKCLITYTKQVLALGVVIVIIALALIVTVLIALGLGALLGLFLSFANGLTRLAAALGWIVIISIIALSAGTVIEKYLHHACDRLETM